MKFGHEFRFVFAAIGLAFLISGLVDALVEDFSVKFFIILGIWLLMWWTSLYEMIYYPTPDDPMLESALLLVAFLCGVFGIHSLTWLLVSIMIGREITEWIWLAPGYYMPRNVFIPLSVAMTALYIVLLYLINALTTEKRVEQ